jgi:membrane-associated phospholipid phosphatase
MLLACSVSPGERRSLMSTESISTRSYSRARPQRAREDASSLAFSVLDREPSAVGRFLARVPGAGHPVWTYICGILISFAVIAGLSIALGLLMTHEVLRAHGIAADDESFVRFLTRHRSAGLTDASLVGSIIAGGVVLPIVAGVAALFGAVARHWRLAGFLLFALAVESGSYRATTLVVHRNRPNVPRLEKLPVDASYPSGHTAASIAVYWGIALLLTSRIASRTARICIWTIAALVPVFVALSRMYRGMHHPLDVAGGVVVGIAALTAMVIVSRAARAAALSRSPSA